MWAFVESPWGVSWGKERGIQGGRHGVAGQGLDQGIADQNAMADRVLRGQETMNYWKQLNHVMKYFRTEEDPKSRLPRNFISGFLEVGVTSRLIASPMTSCRLQLTSSQGRN